MTHCIPSAPVHRNLCLLLFLSGAFALHPLTAAESDEDSYVRLAETYREKVVALDPAFVSRNETRIRTLFQQLDLSAPALKSCADLYATGDLKGAAEALLDYYAAQTKTLPVDPLDHHAEVKIIRRAKDALEGVFTEQNMSASQKRRPDGGLDWADRGPTGDKEWAWFVNRHFFLRDLAEAYFATGDDAYQAAISTYLVDWVQSNPYPARLNFTAQWRPLEAARRVTDAWAAIFYAPGLKLTPEARLLMLCSLHDHADDLANHGSFWGGNHLLTEQSTLALIALAWPEFKDSRKWLDSAVAVTRREIMGQTYPDGAYKELTNHYQHIVVDSLERTMAVLHAANRHDPELDERCDKMWDYYAEVMRPNGDGPLNSASDVEYNRNYVRDAAVTHQRADWTYIASSGKSGTMPELPPSRYFPFAGHAVMRSGWKEDSQWAFFDIGPHGTAHQHNDHLHFDISLGRDDILIDSGRYTYQPGPWHEFFTGASAHNVILVNGKAPIPPPLSTDKPVPVTAIIHAAYDFFSAANAYPADALSGQGGAHHRRSLFYKRGQYWLVIDNLITFGPTRAESLWHFHPSVEVVTDKDGVIHATGKQHTLLIKTVFGPSENWSFVRGETDPIQGWFSREYNTRQPSTAGIAQSTVTRPQTFVRLLYPEGAPVPQVSIQQSGREMTLLVTTTTGTDRISLDPSSGTMPEISVTNP